jgi:hypothetical protein
MLTCGPHVCSRSTTPGQTASTHETGTSHLVSSGVNVLQSCFVEVCGRVLALTCACWCVSAVLEWLCCAQFGSEACSGLDSGS